MKCDELKAFKFGLGQYTENGSPCVVAVDDEENPRLASDEKFYLKSDVDEVIAKLKAKLPRLISVGECFPSADDGYFLALWEDGLPDVGYIGAEDDVIETIRDRGEGHSIAWWMPLPEKFKGAE